MAKHGKVYQSPVEHAKRQAIYETNMAEFADLNAKLTAQGKDAIHGATIFSDMTREEFTEKMLGGAKYTAGDFPKLETVRASSRKLRGNKSYDLRDDNALTAVKDQAQCGSCWAFATTETIESAWAKAGNDIVELSPQQIVSCDTTYGDMGCSGGLPSQAYQYVIDNGGVTTEAEYPYTSGNGVTGTCVSPVPPPTATVSSWAYAQDACLPGSAACVEDSDALKAATQASGIAIAIDASGFFSYTGGIMTNDSCSSDPARLDHAIQVVGWGTDDATGTDYWLVRNSWAEVWGEEGFVRFAMGDNTCGVANMAAYVTSV
jgi:cysteine peptidase B